MRGYFIPPARLTAGAFWLGLLYVGLPFLLAMASLDAITALVVSLIWDSCFGIYCLI